MGSYRYKASDRHWPIYKKKVFKRNILKEKIKRETRYYFKPPQKQKQKKHCQEAPTQHKF